MMWPMQDDKNRDRVRVNKDADHNPNQPPDTVNEPSKGPRPPITEPGPRPAAPAKPSFDRGDATRPSRRDG